MEEQETNQLIPSGGLNLDDDKSMLPKGDYIDALNMIFDEGPEGEDEAIKKLSGLQQVLVDYLPPFSYDGDLKIIDIEVDYSRRAIYILARDDTYSWIWEYLVDDGVPPVYDENLSAWVSLSYGDGVYVAVGIGPEHRVMRSVDGKNWNGVSVPQDNAFRGVDYGNSKFVAVSSDGTNRAMTSTDGGATWVDRTIPLEQFQDVHYSGTSFIAVSGNSPFCDVATSSDGITWEIRACITTTSWSSVVGNGTKVIACGSPVSGGPSTMDSVDDGVTWTSGTGGGGLFIRSSIRYLNNLFIVVSPDSPNALNVSADGLSWTSYNVPVGSSWVDIAYNGALYVLVGTFGVATSPDLTTWTERDSPCTYMNNVIYAGGLFVAVSSFGDVRAMWSEDGINWYGNDSNA